MTYKDTSASDRSVLSIAKSDIFLSPGSYSTGDRFLIVDSAASVVEEDPVLRGSYSWEINGAPTQPSSGTLDVTGTIQALTFTNQNFYGLDVHERMLTTDYDAGNTPAGSHIPGNNNTGDKWTKFVEFLEESKDTDIKVFGTLGKPSGIGNTYTDVWGHKGGTWGGRYPDDDTYHAQCPAEHPDTGATKYAAAAAEMSKLSLTYPNLIGFTIDDFPAYHLNRFDCSYKSSHVRTIQAGAATHNPDFEFWPTHYVGHGLTTAIPSNRIGFTYGFPTTGSEFVAATHDFRIPSSVTVNSAVLEFVYEHDKVKAYAGAWYHDGTGDYTGYECEDVFKGAFVNGNKVLDETISWDKRLQTFSQDVTAHLIKGTNQLRFVISGSGADSSSSELHGRNKWRIFSYGDLRLKIRYTTRTGAKRKIILTEGRPTGRKHIQSAVFSVNSGTIDNHHLHYKYNALSPSASYSPGRVVAETNDEYRYLAECPGAFVYYPNHTGAIEDRTGTVFEAYRRALSDKRLIHGQQAFLFERDAVDDPHIKVQTHTNKFKKAGRSTDGLLVWNLPSDMVSASSGIFAERRAPDYDESGATGTGHTIRTQFLSNNLARMAHYQRFTTKREYGPGTLYFDANFNANSSVYFGTRIYPSGTTNYLYEKLNVTASGNTGRSSISLTASHKITVETFVHRGYGNASLGTTFSCSFNDTATNLDVPLSRSAWDFNSSFSSSYLYDIHKDVTDYYAELGASAASYHNYILELRDDGTWKTIPPEDGMRVYVESEESDRVYSEETLTWRRPSATLIGGLVVSGSEGLVVEHHLLRRGRCAFTREISSQAFSWNSSYLSGAIQFDTTGTMDPLSYEKTSPDTVKILNNGRYRLYYEAGFRNTGSTPFNPPTGSLTVYYATSSALVSDPWPPKILPTTARTQDIAGRSGSFTISNHIGTDIIDLKSGDEIKLYAERDVIAGYSNATGTVGTCTGSMFMMIDRIEETT